MSDLLFQNMSTVQSDKQPTPKTIVTAATIAPDTFLTILSGSTTIQTITAPVTGTHVLAIIAGATESVYTTTGNIVGLTTASTTQPSLFVFNPITGKYIRTVA